MEKHSKNYTSYSIFNKFTRADQGACIIREIRKRRMTCDELLDKLGSGKPMSESQMAQLDCLNQQVRHDAAIAVRMGVTVAIDATTGGFSANTAIAKGTAVAAAKAAAKIAAPIAGDATNDEDYLSLNPAEWHVWSMRECED